MKHTWLIISLAVSGLLINVACFLGRKVVERHAHDAQVVCQQTDWEGEWGIRQRIPNPAWQNEPKPVHQTASPAYWQMWCRQTWGTEISRPGARQTALDWSDHCTLTGDANGR